LASGLGPLHKIFFSRATFTYHSSTLLFLISRPFGPRKESYSFFQRTGQTCSCPRVPPECAPSSFFLAPMAFSPFRWLRGPLPQSLALGYAGFFPPAAPPRPVPVLPTTACLPPTPSVPQNFCYTVLAFGPPRPPLFEHNRRFPPPCRLSGDPPLVESAHNLS